MKSLAKLFILLEGRHILLYWLVCSAIGILDFFVIYPKWYFLLILLICISISITISLNNWVNEFKNNTFPYLESLPINRFQIWWSKYTTGFIIMLGCIIPILLGRYPYFNIPSNNDMFFTLQYLFSGLTFKTYVISSLLLAFNFYSISFFICLCGRRTSLSLTMVINIILILCFFLGATGIPVLTNLFPNLYDLMPLYAFSGIFFIMGAYTVFVPTYQRNWTLSRAIILTIVNIIIITFAQLFLLSVYIAHWNSPDLTNAKYVKFKTSTNSPDYLHVSFANRLSGFHEVILNMKSNQNIFNLPKYSSLLKNSKGDFVINHNPFYSYFYVPKRLLLNQNPAPFLVSKTLTPSTHFEKESFFNTSSTKLNKNYNYPGHTISNLDFLFTWHAEGTRLVAQLDTSVGRKFPFLKRFIRSGTISFIVFNKSGQHLNTIHIPQKRLKGIYKNDTKLLILSHPQKGAAKKTLTYKLINIKSFKSTEGTIPAGFHISKSLSRAANLVRTPSNGRYYYSLQSFNLLTGNQTTIIGKDALPSHDIKNHLTNIKVMYDPQIEKALLYTRQAKKDKLYSNLKYCNLKTKKVSTILSTNEIPVYNFLTPSRRVYINAKRFSPNSRYAYFVLSQHLLKKQQKSEQWYKYDCTSNKLEKINFKSRKLGDLKLLSQDGLHAIYINKSNRINNHAYDTIYILNLATSKQERIFPPENQNITSDLTIFSCKWIDRKKIVFTCNESIWTVNIDGSNLQKVFP